MTTSRAGRWLLLPVLGCGLLIARLATPAVTPDLDDALRDCAKRAESSARLACFDAIVIMLPKVEADRVGMTVDIKRHRDPAAVQQDKGEMLAGKIVALRQGARGELIVTLDNKQVWHQEEPRVGVEFLVGDEVHIEHGAMSSLWLVADKHRKIRVKRLT